VAAADRSDWPVALAALAGLAAALIVAMGAANLDGDDGTALWLTRMVPGTEAADVRGRQAAWLLVVAPVMLALTVTLTALSGLEWAWPWVAATLPAMLGATAGLGVLLSVTRPVRQKDPHRRTGPFDTGDDPNMSSRPGLLARHAARGRWWPRSW
jgi:ABC-2 type transport system permease protein